MMKVQPLAGASPALSAQRPGLGAAGGRASLSFHFLGRKPGTCGQNYSSHRAARQQEEGAQGAGKGTQGGKENLPASQPRERAAGEPEGAGRRGQDGGGSGGRRAVLAGRAG